MAVPTFPADNTQMGDHFAAVYEATAHRITGPVSNTALDLMGIGPGTGILDIAAGAGALSGPAAEHDLWRNPVFRLAPRSAGAGPGASLRRQGLRRHLR